MSVTTPKGFSAAGVVAGIKSTGKKDVTVVLNEGPLDVAAAVLTSMTPTESLLPQLRGLARQLQMAGLGQWS